jgi:uncharacterized protein (DUF433 family)
MDNHLVYSYRGEEEPRFNGTRIKVSQVVAMLRQGASTEELLENYPTLSKEMIEYAGTQLSGKTRAEIQEIVDKISFMDRTFRLLPKGDGYLLQLSYYEADVETGEMALQRARKWYISPWMTETEIVETAFAACRRSMDHILKEHFTYKGRRVYSPHFGINGRIELCDMAWFDRRPDNRPKLPIKVKEIRDGKDREPSK